MFCPNCGKNLPDNAAFCDGCGSRMAAAPAPVQPQAPVQVPMYAAAPSQPNPMVDNTVAALKGFFSANPADAVAKAGKSNGLEWIILAGITALLNMLYLAISPCQYGGDFDALGLVEGLLSTGIWFFGIAFGVVLLYKVIYKQNIAPANAFNLTSVAMLPLGCTYLLNLIFGFVWSGFTNTFASVALIAFALLLYVAIQNLAGNNGALLLGLLVLFAALFLVDAAFSALWFEITIPSAPSYSYGDFDMDDYGDLLEDMF